MNYDKLVDLIVEEVYKRLNNSQKVYSNKKVAVILDKKDINKYEEILRNEYTLIEYDESIKECDIVIIPQLCLSGMANIANLTSSSDREYFTIKMLMMGKKVYVLEDGLHYRRYKNTAPKALYNKFLEFEKQLINFGVEIIPNPFHIENTKESSVYSKDITPINNLYNNESYDIRNKKIITEADIRKHYINGAKVILVDKSSIITPLAQDFVKINRIEIIRK